VKTHELKTEPPYFQAVLDGRKKFEIRKNDRDFQVGDKLILKEYDADVHVFTGRKVEVTVTYMTDYAQQPGYVVLGIESQFDIEGFFKKQVEKFMRDADEFDKEFEEMKRQNEKFREEIHKEMEEKRKRFEERRKRFEKHWKLFER
jgi:ASC-1-like (ASCH) protein